MHRRVRECILASPMKVVNDYGCSPSSLLDAGTFEEYEKGTNTNVWGTLYVHFVAVISGANFCLTEYSICMCFLGWLLPDSLCMLDFFHVLTMHYDEHRILNARWILASSA